MSMSGSEIHNTEKRFVFLLYLSFQCNSKKVVRKKKDECESFLSGNKKIWELFRNISHFWTSSFDENIYLTRTFLNSTLMNTVRIFKNICIHENLMLTCACMLVKNVRKNHPSVHYFVFLLFPAHWIHSEQFLMIFSTRWWYQVAFIM